MGASTYLAETTTNCLMGILHPLEYARLQMNGFLAVTTRLTLQVRLRRYKSSTDPLANFDLVVLPTLVPESTK